MKIKEWLKNHLLVVCLFFSAMAQIGALLFIPYGNVDSALDKKYIPMTIMPEIKQETATKELPKKTIQETKEPTEEIVKEEKPVEENISQTTSQISQNNPIQFLPFVKVDEIAVPKSSLVPEYPEMARNAGIEGTVVLEVYIDETGMVQKVRVVKGLGFGCEEAAIKKVQATQFIPANMGGKPVAVRQIITFEFKLR